MKKKLDKSLDRINWYLTFTMFLGRFNLKRIEDGNTEARKENGGLREQIEEDGHQGLREQREQDGYAGLREQIEEDRYPGESGTLQNLQVRF